MYPKIVLLKSSVHGHDPKFLFPHRYKTVPSVYNENTSTWGNRGATVKFHMELLQSRSGATPKHADIHGQMRVFWTLIFQLNSLDSVR